MNKLCTQNQWMTINPLSLRWNPSFIFIFGVCLLGTFQVFSQTTVTVAPPSCYMPNTAADQNIDAAADATGATPFATWKGAIDYVTANPSVTTIDFVAGTYATSIIASSEWGDANGGFVIPDGVTVNGNGALIDNAPVGSSQVCFATMGSNTTIDGFSFNDFSGVPNGGAIFVPATANNWTLSNCNFENCNNGTDALTVNMGANQTGTITGCNFYNNSNPGAANPSATGTPSSSAMDITGDLSSDLDIINTSFSCNFRNVSGGAVKIEDDVHVDFIGCTFYNNEANSSTGGAVDIGSGAEVTFTNTTFLDNFTSGAGTPLGGALSIQSGATVVITDCNFTGNSAVEDGGAIEVQGTITAVTNVTITGTIFEGNSVSGAFDGGALYISSYGNVSVNNSLFLNNASPDKGGAIWISSTTSPKTLNVTNSTFTGNTSGGNEGTITSGFGSAGDVINITNSIVESAGILSIEDEGAGTTTVTNSFYGNESGTVDGGGNTAGYSPTFDANFNDPNGGWNGTYSMAINPGACPSTPTVADVCPGGCTDCLNATCEHETISEQDWGNGLTVTETEMIDAGADTDCEDFTATAENMTTVCTEFVATGNETALTVAAEGAGCTGANLSIMYELSTAPTMTSDCGNANGNIDGSTGEITTDLVSGTTYQYCVTVDFSADAACDIDNVCPVILNCDTRPMNDDICDVDAGTTWDLMAGTPLVNQNNYCATLETGEPTGGEDQSVWYEYTVPAGTDAINVSTLNNDFNTVITVYTATLDCSNPPASVDLSTQLDMPAVAQNDDAATATMGESSADFCVMEGVTYYIQVDGNADGEEGVFDILVTDITGTLTCCTDCLNASCPNETVSEQDWGNGLTVTETEMIDAGADTDCEDFTATAENMTTVCTEFVATGNETALTVAAEGAGCTGANLSIMYELSTAPTMTSDCGNANGNIDGSTGEITTDLVSGTTYQYCVTVDFSADATCDIDNVCPVILECTVMPANDDICNAFDLSGGSLTAQNNICATLETNETTGGEDQSVWYEYIVPAGVQAITVATLNNDFNTTVAIYTGTPNCAGAVDLSTDISLVPGGTNDDSATATNGESAASICVDAGTTYYIQVDGNAAGENGNFDITVTDATGTIDCGCDADNGTLMIGN